MPNPTDGPVLNHSMIRVKDPARSIDFYRDQLGMTLLDRYDFPASSFSLYFLGYPAGPVPDERGARVKWVFEQRGLLELTHNWGSEDDPEFSYHNGNSDPRGFGHLGLCVPDVQALCDKLEAAGVEFVKRPQDGSMKGIAFVKDPDGYWIELLTGDTLRDLVMGMDGN